MNKELCIRPKAYWRTNWEPCGSSKAAHSATCTNCNKASRMPVGDFCKWCGARMIGHFDYDNDLEVKNL